MRFMCVLACLLGAASVAPAQEPPRPQTVLRDSASGRTVIEISIHESGILDASFLNQQNPPNLRRLAPIDSVDLQFRNLTTTTDFQVRIGATRLSLPQSHWISIPLREVIAALDGQTAGQFEVWSNGSTIPDGVGYFVVTPAAPAPTAAAPPPTFAPAQAATRDPILPLSIDPSSRVASAVSRLLKPVPTSSGVQTVEERRRIVQIPLNGVGVDDWEFRNLRNPPYLLMPGRGENEKTLGDTYRREVARKADQTEIGTKVAKGIEDIDKEFTLATDAYEKARNDPEPSVREKAHPPQNPWARLALLRATDIEFINESVDRTFTVTVDIPTPVKIADAKTTYERDAQRTDFEVQSGLKLGECVTGPPATCKVVINLPFQSPKAIAAQWLAGEDPEEALNFITWYRNINKGQPAVTFSVNFFDENATPAESAAYVSLVPLSSLREATSKTGWTLSPTLGASREPLVGDKAEFSTEEDKRFPGDIRRQFTGAAKLTLKQTLGSRADATVEFAFKGGPLGEKGYTGAVSTPMYQVNINSVPGLRLSFGKFLFANPANNIAVREVGEGFRIGIRNRLAVSHLFKRESLDGAPDTGNNDHKVYLFEANNLAGRRWTSVRGVNLLVSLGWDRAPKTKHRYWTAGFDMQFAVPDSPFSGSAAYFHSERTPLGNETDPAIVRGTGDVAFTTVSYSYFKKPTSPTQPSRKVGFSVRGEWGLGSGDKRSTPRDESYLGETAAFAPDVFFLSTFAGKLSVIGPAITGLRNKQYFAAVYQEERLTPLDVFAKLLTIPEGDIASRLLRAGLRAYYFNGDIADDNDQHDAGRELFLESQIETPAGVKSSLAVSYFRPGTAIRDYFKNRSLWSVVSKVTVTLGS